MSCTESILTKEQTKNSVFFFVCFFQEAFKKILEVEKKSLLKKDRFAKAFHRAKSNQEQYEKTVCQDNNCIMKYLSCKVHLQ